MIGNEAVRGSPDADELLGATFDETELTQMAVTDADWLSVQVPDGQCKFPRLWPPQTPPGKDGAIMTGQC